MCIMTASSQQPSFASLIAGEKPVLVDFFAEWCGPCKHMGPILHELKHRVGDRISIIKVDVDRSPAVAAQYQVQAVPTLILFRKGQVQWRGSGVTPANQLQQLIESVLAGRSG